MHQTLEKVRYILGMEWPIRHSKSSSYKKIKIELLGRANECQAYILGISFFLYFVILNSLLTKIFT